MNIYSIIPKFLKYIYNRYLCHWINNIVRKSSFKRELVNQVNFQPPISILEWNTEFDISEKRNVNLSF